MRYVLVAVTLAILGSSAGAGQRCARRDYIILSPEAELDEYGRWQRIVGENRTFGTLSREAIARIVPMERTTSIDERVRCLDALIADEHGIEARRACVAKRVHR
jgi:hypothetical protein